MNKYTKMFEPIVNSCYKKSIDLLISNSSEYGILACSHQKKAIDRNYLSIFARDISICTLGIVASKNKKLLKLAKKSLLELAKHQAANGEIPNYVKPESKVSNFWHIGCIDATLWWLLAVEHYDKHAQDLSLIKSVRENTSKAIDWLHCQEHPEDGLLRQGEASDWADIMPRSGKVLYSNALWYKVKREYHLEEPKKTHDNFNSLFHPFDSSNESHCNKPSIEVIKKSVQKTDFYLSFVNYLYWGEDVDIYGNSLAILSGLASKEFQNNFIDYILSRKILNNYPVPVILNPILENSFLWRPYMNNHHQNLPYQYHNGGTWPFASCFFAMCLHKNGRRDEAREELAKIAHLNKANNWQFNEWFHSKTGHAHGMRGQSWNAGMFLFAYHFLKDEIDF